MHREVEELLGYRFRRPELLREALTHKSHAFEKGAGRHNERLEFLGDSILAAAVAHRLFEDYPDADEGRLSKMKAALVSRTALTRWASRLGLGKHLFLGTGEESTGGRDRPSILANALESILGAVYLDGGYPQAKEFIDRLLLDGEPQAEETDHKSRLQELVQKRYKVPPDYRLLKTTGPDHDKTFAVRVQVAGRVLGSGKGKSKKEAEQAAAQDALRSL